MPTMRLVSVTIISIVFLTFLISLGVAQTGRSTKPVPPPKNNQILYDLNGRWITNDGEEIELVCPGCPLQGQAILGGPPKTNSSIQSRFTGGGACKFGGRRTFFIDGSLIGKKLTGHMLRCTQSEPLFKDCGVNSVYPTDFRANVISKDEIYGYFRSEWWGPGGSGQCKYTRDKSGDHDVAFGLTRKQPKAAPASTPAAGCPSGEQKKSSDDNKALELVKDGFKKALKMLDEQRKEMDRNPSAFKDLAQAKEELDEKIKGIKGWLDFWDSINAAACMPPQVSQLLQRYAQETQQNQSTSDFCTNMCVETIDWFSKINSIPDYRKYQLKVGCMAATCN